MTDSVMIHCTVCNSEKNPTVEMQTDGRLVKLCPTCNCALGEITKPTYGRAPVSPTKKCVAILAPVEQATKLAGESLEDYLDKRIEFLEAEVLKLKHYESELKSALKAKRAAGFRKKKPLTLVAKPDGSLEMVDKIGQADRRVTITRYGGGGGGPAVNAGPYSDMEPIHVVAGSSHDVDAIQENTSNLPTRIGSQ